MKSPAAGLEGLFLLDKPQGLTSHDAALRLRRLSGQKKTGHTGALDPMATGLLPVLFGAATRLEPYLSKMPKTYWGRLELGLSTDTDDLEGRVLSRAAGPWPGGEEVALALKAEEGEKEQIPPDFSAVRVGGLRAYRAARAGRPLALAPRRVTAFSLEIISYEPPGLEFKAEVSSGYYIRALARDLGRALGLGGGALSALRRLRVGPFRLEEARTLEEVSGWSAERWRAGLKPPAEALPHWPSWVLAESRAALAFTRGLPAPAAGLADQPDDARYKVLDAQGRLLGLGQIDAALAGGSVPPRGPFLRPLRVFPVL